MKRARFEFQWHHLKDANGNDFTYGAQLGKLCSQTAHPAIYRWSVECDGKRIKTYIGETELLGRRHYRYLNPGPTQQSNLRLREEFLSLGARGYQVFFDTFEFEPFEINGIEINLQLLDRQYAGRFVEALVGLEFEEGVESQQVGTSSLAVRLFNLKGRALTPCGESGPDPSAAKAARIN